MLPVNVRKPANGVILQDLCLYFMNNSIRRPFDLEKFLISGIESYFAYLTIIRSVKSVTVESRYYSAIIRTMDDDVQVYVPKNFFRDMSLNFGMYARSIIINARPDMLFIDGLYLNNHIEELEYNWHNKDVFFSIISKPRQFKKFAARDYVLKMLVHHRIYANKLIVYKSDSWKLIPLISQFCPTELIFVDTDNILDEVVEIMCKNSSAVMEKVEKFTFETRRTDLDENLIYYLCILKRLFPNLREISILINSLNYMVPPKFLQLMAPGKLKEFIAVISVALDTVKVSLDLRRYLYLGILYDLNFIQNYEKEIHQLFDDVEMAVDGRLGVVASGNDGNVSFKIDLRVEPAGYANYPQY